MSIPAIGSAIVRPGVLGGAPKVGDAVGTEATSSGGFGGALGRAVGSVEQSQQKADSLAQLAATGQLDDVHEYTIAAAQAQVATQLTVAVRNKAVDSFNEIMRMPV
jgi:flagellar hook-basal body complex protein FliE